MLPAALVLGMDSILNQHTAVSEELLVQPIRRWTPVDALVIEFIACGQKKKLICEEIVS